jgi:ferredoxin
MIRPLRDEVERYGHYSLAAESMYDHPFQWGSKRTGPDLARVGAKYSDEWHVTHLISPRAIVPQSVMPGYPFLAEADLDYHDIAAHLKTNQVTYRHDRGEPRVSIKKADELRSHGLPAGDCVDCYQCVAVCPTGIDIRNGAQLDCIMCGLCIDACDNIMKKIGRPTGLIAYDTDINIARRREGKTPIYRIVRPRTMVYAGLIALVGAVMVYALLTRSYLEISVRHDRNPLFVTLSDGSIRNAHTVTRLRQGRGPRPQWGAADEARCHGAVRPAGRPACRSHRLARRA